MTPTPMPTGLMGYQDQSSFLAAQKFNLDGYSQGLTQEGLGKWGGGLPKQNQA